MGRLPVFTLHFFFLFSQVSWHRHSLSSETSKSACFRDPTVFLGVTQVDSVVGDGFSLPSCHLDLPHKLISFCYVLTSHDAAPKRIPRKRKKKKNRNSPASMWNKNAHNSAAVEQGTGEVEPKTGGGRWEEKEREGKRGRKAHEKREKQARPRE